MTDPADPESREPLLYRSGIDEAQERVRPPYVVQVILGFVIAAIMTAGVTFGGAMLSGGMAGGVGALILIVLVMFAIGAAQMDEPKHRGWAVGIMLGTGVGLLLEGVCFAVLSR
jgi:hypothetical protein